MGEWIEAELRPCVRWFAAKMEEILQENDHKSGWMGDDCDDGYLYQNMMKELGELANEMFVEVGHNLEVVAECVDVANYAMMIAERAWAFEHVLEEERRKKAVGRRQEVEEYGDNNVELCHRCLSAALAYALNDDDLVFCRACGSVVTDPLDARDAARCIAIADRLPHDRPLEYVGEVNEDG